MNINNSTINNSIILTPNEDFSLNTIAAAVAVTLNSAPITKSKTSTATNLKSAESKETVGAGNNMAQPTFKRLRPVSYGLEENKVNEFFRLKDRLIEINRKEKIVSRLLAESAYKK